MKLKFLSKILYTLLLITWLCNDIIYGKYMLQLCNIDFVKKFNNPEPLNHFRRLVYHRRQGFNATNSIENLKIKEEMQ
ncbi:12386_t:CDS:2 [Ambispora leptoticha]|uniref:12386_t:CDS:1 n=1 Tax=Ambispora leptoticha TaxID=144679 RepID=A0A9N8ZWH3_9GLOM|nr:12386_t:CDS:2 [Ambispora leptoticha]